MATKAFQKIYTKITQITKATCSLKATGVGYDELATVNGKLAQVVKRLFQFLYTGKKITAVLIRVITRTPRITTRPSGHTVMH